MIGELNNQPNPPTRPAAEPRSTRAEALAAESAPQTDPRRSSASARAAPVRAKNDVDSSTYGRRRSVDTTETEVPRPKVKFRPPGEDHGAAPFVAEGAPEPIDFQPPPRLELEADPPTYGPDGDHTTRAEPRGRYVDLEA